ncbi:hypothetical protein CBS101457_003022 [Exobasidium rhododendri]|nr:hypothetical protein CBS101457_003022 [Exobasidium rhododendri]
MTALCRLVLLVLVGSVIASPVPFRRTDGEASELAHIPRVRTRSTNSSHHRSSGAQTSRLNSYANEATSSGSQTSRNRPSRSAQRNDNRQDPVEYGGPEAHRRMLPHEWNALNPNQPIQFNLDGTLRTEGSRYSSSSNLFALPPMYSQDDEPQYGDTHGQHSSLERALAGMNLSTSQGLDHDGSIGPSHTYSVQQMEDYHRQLQEYEEVASAYSVDDGHGPSAPSSRASTSSRRRDSMRQTNEADEERPNQLIWSHRDSTAQLHLLAIVSKRRGIKFRDAQEVLPEKLTRRLEDDLLSGMRARVDLALRRMFPFSDRYKAPVWMQGLEDDECEGVVTKLQEASRHKKDVIRNHLMRYQVSSDVARSLLLAPPHVAVELAVRINLLALDDDDTDEDNDGTLYARRRAEARWEIIQDLMRTYGFSRHEATTLISHNRIGITLRDRLLAADRAQRPAIINYIMTGAVSL